MVSLLDPHTGPWRRPAFAEHAWQAAASPRAMAEPVLPGVGGTAPPGPARAAAVEGRAPRAAVRTHPRPFRLGAASSSRLPARPCRAGTCGSRCEPPHRALSSRLTREPTAAPQGWRTPESWTRSPHPSRPRPHPDRFAGVGENPVARRDRCTHAASLIGASVDPGRRLGRLQAARVGTRFGCLRRAPPSAPAGASVAGAGRPPPLRIPLISGEARGVQIRTVAYASPPAGASTRPPRSRRLGRRLNSGVADLRCG
jgi:hypothetical protein